MNISSNLWRIGPRSFSFLRAPVGSVVKWAARGCRMVLFLLLMAQSATAQVPEDADGAVLIDVRVNHGVAYRPEYWTPVDVLVSNTERDVEGYIEVRLRDFSNNLMSPVYRLPATSPKESKKLFRLYCKLEGARRLEAQLHHGNRPVVPLPTTLDLSPIEPTDLLGLVLDETFHDYGFLSSEKVIGRQGQRFHREGLREDQVDRLSDHLSSYQAFDIIVLGNIDPERIAPLHRDLLVQYVESGGTLAVSLGRNAARYTGTWVEPLLGVAIGQNTETTDQDLGARAFGAGLPTENSGVATALQPTGEGVVSIGKDFAAGAWRRHGAGTIATFTVDAHTQLLNSHPEFLKAWHDLIQRGGLTKPLDLRTVAQMASVEMPRIAGVRLFPVSSILLYLFLYFGIGIVGNWLFWNRLKRREMAWVSLVFISFAFTAYAMIFGTQGRARSTELEQLEILEIANGAPRATLHGLTGLLAKGSGRFDAQFTNELTLADDVSHRMSANMANSGGGGFAMASATPFQFVQGEPGGITSLTVGASEMRFVRTEAPLTLPGALEADLALEGDYIRGTIANKTGLTLEGAILMYRGGTFNLTLSEGPSTVSLDLREPNRDRPRSLPFQPQNAMTLPPDVEASARGNFQAFLSNLCNHIALAPETGHRPRIVGWATGPQRGSLDMGAYASPHFGATLVVAWVDIENRNATADRIELVVGTMNPEAGMNMYQMPGGYGYYDTMEYTPTTFNFPPLDIEDASHWPSATLQFHAGQQLDFQVAVPPGLTAGDDYELEVVVTTAANDPNQQAARPGGGLVFSNPDEPNGGRYAPVRTQLFDPANSQPLGIAPGRNVITLDNGEKRHREVYRIAQWRGFLGHRDSSIELRVDSDRSGANPYHRVHIGAQLIKTSQATSGE